MSEIEKPWCPCQEERFEAAHPSLPKSDMPYVDEVDYLEEVKSAYYYEREQEKAAKDAPAFATNVGPSVPYTRRGRKIISDNFPDADYVCPCCETEYVEEVTVTPRKS